MELNSRPKDAVAKQLGELGSVHLWLEASIGRQCFAAPTRCLQLVNQSLAMYEKLHQSAVSTADVTLGFSSLMLDVERYENK